MLAKIGPVQIAGSRRMSRKVTAAVINGNLGFVRIEQNGAGMLSSGTDLQG